MRRILAAAAGAALLLCIAAASRADLRRPARDGAADGRGGGSPSWMVSSSAPGPTLMPVSAPRSTPTPGSTSAPAFGPAYTPTPSLASAPASDPASAPAHTSTPDATPALNPTSTPIPRVDAQWYIDRDEQLRALLKRNGSFQSQYEIDAAIEKMYIDPERPMVALTFDDGPAPGVTDAILDILEEYNVRATFFIVGCRLKKPEAVQTVRRAISLGCEIGNHTWAHETLTRQNARQKYDAIKKTNRIVFDNTGYVMRSLRPPGGYYDWEVSYLARRNGMAVVKWAQSGDVYEQEPARIARNVQRQFVNGKELHAGDIILLHDTQKPMIAAVRTIVPQLLEAGYQLVTAWELINCSQAGFVAGKTYHHQ